MPILPWRVKASLSKHFPLGYHLVANLGAKGNSAEHWDRMLEQTWDDPARAWPTKVELIASLCRPETRILDVACGTGSILRELKRRGYSQLHALEISNYAVTRLNAEGIHARCGRLPQIGFSDHEFDVVVASQVLEHIIRRTAFAKEIRRVLKPGGRAYIFVPDNCLGPIDEPEHVIVYTAATLRAFLSRFFAVDRVESMHDANHPAPVLFAEVHT
jgi:2-polyprenyl-3-methyl-5-hydroxy-6-metoxy-1,4-benzoquinol methylase